MSEHQHFWSAWWLTVRHLDDFGYRCSCGVALLFEEDNDG